MTRTILITVCFFLAGVPCLNFLQAQEYYRADDGFVKFESDAPLEFITASSNTLKGILDISKGSFAFSVEISTLEGFNNPLQKVHFNENYMESKEFPTANFTGKIIEKLDFEKPGKYNVRAKGILKIHGIERERIIQGELEVTDDGIAVSANFSVLLEDHSISIPKIVHQKIAETIEVEIRIILKPQ